jgi:DNA repair protein RadD
VASAALLRCGVPAGIWSAGCGRKERASVLVASVQSIYRQILDHEPFDLLLVDECHLCPDKGMGMYRQLIERMRVQRPQVKVAGFTATPFRLGSGLLTDGDMFDDIAYEITIHELLSAGHLAPLTTRAGRHKINLEGVRIQKGDYSMSDLSASMAFDDVTQRALDEAVQRGADRRSWLVFCVSVWHAEQARDLLRERGGPQPLAERRAVGRAERRAHVERHHALAQGALAARAEVTVAA